MDAQAIRELDQNYVLGVYPRSEFVIERGEGVVLYDSEGRSYIDCAAGIAVNALGHNDPEIVDTIHKAGGLIHLSNLYLTAPQARLAQRLVETSFADKVFFCNSGAEANEGAFKFARKYARHNGAQGDEKTAIVAFSNAFHGRLFATLAATPREAYQAPFRPLVPGVRYAEYNDIDSATETIKDDVCAVIVEPVQGEGGIHSAAPGFLNEVRRLCDERGALLIFDEVQCGLGRTGTLWAHQQFGVEPDILTAAKPLAGGLPMGAILMKQKVAEVMAVGDHGSTFGGGPLVASVANVVVRRVSDPVFLADVKAKGEYFMERLEELNSPHIQEVRGRGLMIGVQLDIPTADVIKAGYQKGVILLNAGSHVLRLVPPLIISREQIDQVVETLGEILHEM